MAFNNQFCGSFLKTITDSNFTWIPDVSINNEKLNLITGRDDSILFEDL